MTANTSPIKHYLAQSIRTNGKWVLVAWVGVLVSGLILVLGRLLPPIQNLLSEVILGGLVVNIPLKAAFIVIPLVLLCRSKTHKEWQEVNSDTPITRKEFSAASYLEIFLSTLLGLPALGIIWIVAGLTDPAIVEYILTVGVFGLGEGFLWVSLMATLIYTLQFTPLVKIAEGSILILIGLFGPLWIIASLLQPISWDFINYEGVPIPLVVVIYILAGLIVLVVGKTITAKLYEEIDL